MSPNDVRTLTNVQLLELLVSLRPGTDDAVSWLASVIADPVMVEGVKELSQRYLAEQDGKPRLPRAKCASSLMIDGSKFKRVMWLNRIPMNQIGPMIGKSEGWGSVTAHKQRLSFWAADAIATELGVHVGAFIESVASSEELERLAACV